MPNEKVSQMTVLTAAEIAAADIFLVGDISAQESKKMTADQLLLYVESSGSFNAVFATTAGTASMVLGSNVNGTVASASYAIHAGVADLATLATNATNAVSASYVAASALVDSASYLVFSPTNGTASHATTAGSTTTATNATNATSLNYPNTSTASYSISGSFTISASYAATASLSTTSSYSLSGSFVTTASYADTASYANNFNSPIKAWAMLTWSVAFPFYSSPAGGNCIYMNNNVSSFNSLGYWTQGNWTWFNYGITFTSPLPSTNYILSAQAYSPYFHPQEGYVIFHPVYSNRTTSSFTMSLALDNTVTVPVTDWFLPISGSYPNDNWAYITLQVVG